MKNVFVQGDYDYVRLKWVFLWVHIFFEPKEKSFSRIYTLDVDKNIFRCEVLMK